MTIEDLIKEKFDELGWEQGDEIIIKIGGTRTSCIHQTPDANPKWAPAFGTVVHNKDAFMVIQNETRRDSTKSQAPDKQSQLTISL